uniref:Uncharacterized protein n=1 Tax=Arundo donax TaxID=35708 RepID=A0A0A8Z782_ARUDO
MEVAFGVSKRDQILHSMILFSASEQFLQSMWLDLVG